MLTYLFQIDQVPMNWGLSPHKKRQSPNFLEMELPEDEEEDEDFTPTVNIVIYILN